MSKYSWLLVAVAATGVGAATPSLAAAPMGVAGILTGQFSSTSGSTSANTWSGHGQLAAGIGNDFAGEVIGGIASIASPSGGSGTLLNIGASAFWAPAIGRAGLTVNYQSIDISGGNVHFTQYGAFGEHYTSENLTLGLNGGGMSIAGCPGCSDGHYIGGGGIFYPMPNLGITGAISHTDLFNTGMTSIGLTGEWFYSEEAPISGFLGYNRIVVSGPGDDANQFIAGFKIYTSGNGDTLIQKQRNGALDNLVRNGLNILW